MSIAEKITTTISFGVTIAAKGAAGALGKCLKNATHNAILFGKASIITRVQFMSGIDVAVDMTFCIVNVEMYTSDEPEHRENVGKSKQPKRFCDPYR